jgi:tetratricopeptide (TPR) repeat protein
MPLPESLRTSAWFYSQNAENDKARAQFEAELEQNVAPAMLVELSDQFGSLPQVAVPALKKLVELSPKNVGYLVRLGMAHWMAGDDTAAEQTLAQATSILPDDIEVLNLAAALARDNDTKRDIYARMLELYPNNRVAWENLVALRTPEHASHEHRHEHEH